MNGSECGRGNSSIRGAWPVWFLLDLAPIVHLGWRLQIPKESVWICTIHWWVLPCHQICSLTKAICTHTHACGHVYVSDTRAHTCMCAYVFCCFCLERTTAPSTHYYIDMGISVFVRVRMCLFVCVCEKDATLWRLFSAILSHTPLPNPTPSCWIIHSPPPHHSHYKYFSLGDSERLSCATTGRYVLKERHWEHTHKQQTCAHTRAHTRIHT